MQQAGHWNEDQRLEFLSLGFGHQVADDLAVRVVGQRHRPADRWMVNRARRHEFEFVDGRPLKLATMKDFAYEVAVGFVDGPLATLSELDTKMETDALPISHNIAITGNRRSGGRSLVELRSML